MTEAKPIDAPETVPPVRKSKGEKLFDWLVYGGIGYIGTFITTVLIADRLQTSGAGKSVKGFFEKIGFSKKFADRAADTTILMPGGSVMLLPIYLMELVRKPTVRLLDRMFTDSTKPVAEVADVPPQTFGSLVKGRLVAWGVVFAGMVGLQSIIGAEKFEAFSNNTGTQLAKAFKVPAAGRESHWIFRYGKLAALDAFATLFSSALLYTSSKFFAQRREEHQEYLTRHPERARRAAAYGDKAEAAADTDAPAAEIRGQKQHEGPVNARETAAELQPAR